MDRVEAPAKLTLSLRVGPRQRDGYHPIEAEMVMLSLSDRLVLTPTEGPSALEVRTSPLVGAAHRYETPVEGNLVLRALALAGTRRRVVLEKCVPVGAGLGGGSADAAAVLRAMGTQVPHTTLVRELGSDVPACVVGGHVLVTGNGTEVTPLEEMDLVVTLFVPDFPVATGAVYAAFDTVGPSGETNDLLGAAEAVEPRLGVLRRVLESRFGRPVELAGSGSTLFVRASLTDLGLEPSLEQGPNRAVELIVAGTHLACIESVSIPRR